MVHDLSVGLHQGLGVERRLAVQHLVHADAQRPPVALWPVLALPILHGLEDLRGDVVRGAHSHRGLDLADGQSNSNNNRKKKKNRQNFRERKK